MCTVLCIGDSITEGIGSSDTLFCYVSELQVLLGNEYKVINLGRNGATLTCPPNGNRDNYKIMPHFIRAVNEARDACKRKDKVVISVMLGTNDADVFDYGYPTDSYEFYNKIHDEFIREYFNIIDTLLNEAPDSYIIVCKSPFSYDNIKHRNFGNLQSVWRFQQEVADICAARKNKVIINDMASATSPYMIGDKGVALYFRDALHPNDVGHMYFAHFFCDAVRKVLQL